MRTLWICTQVETLHHEGEIAIEVCMRGHSITKEPVMYDNMLC